MSARVCHYCSTADTELRPYGPGGTWTCFPCMKATPEREEQAHNALGVLLDGAAAVSASGVVAIDEETGPRPFDPNEAAGGVPHA